MAIVGRYVSASKRADSNDELDTSLSHFHPREQRVRNVFFHVYVSLLESERKLGGKLRIYRVERAQETHLAPATVREALASNAHRFLILSYLDNVAGEHSAVPAVLVVPVVPHARSRVHSHHPYTPPHARQRLGRTTNESSLVCRGIGPNPKSPRVRGLV